MAKHTPHLTLSIRNALQKIQRLQCELDELLLGDYEYVIDTDTFLGEYKYQRERFSSYLKLDDAKQNEYCRKRLCLREQYYQTALLFEQSDSIPLALNFHYKAIQEGRLNALFNVRKKSNVASDKIPDDPFYQGMFYLLGMGHTPDYQLAKDNLTKVKEKNKPFAQFLLGLMYYYGLGMKKDHAMAKHYFTKAKSEKTPIIYQYLALCDLEKAHYAKASRHLKPALKHGLPMAQTITGLLYEKGYGTFFHHKEKAGNLFRLSAYQRQYAITHF